MGALSKILRDGEDGRLFFLCPGCDMVHGISHGPGEGPRWTWNGNKTKPTFSPSILVRWDQLSEAGRRKSQEHYEETGSYLTPAQLPYDIHHVCHSYVVDGRIQFLNDCTHALAGQTVDLPAFKW